MSKKNVIPNQAVIEYKSGTAYSAHHKPTGEHWLLLGINPKTDRVCAAGWPPSIASLSHCINIEELRPLTAEELRYREDKFGTDWL